MRNDGHILVIGAAGFDIKGRSHHTLQPATSNPGQIRNSFGGVARNIAENLARLEIKTVLLTAVGDDAAGDILMAQVAAAGVEVAHILQVVGGRSGSYIAVLDDDGDLSVAVSDYDIIGQLTPDFFQQKADLFEQARMVVIDLNLTGDAIEKIIALSKHYQVPVCVDPTSPAHAVKICNLIQHFYMIAPNAAETTALCGLEIAAHDRDTALSAAKHLVTLGVEVAIVSLGDKGVVYANRAEGGYIDAKKTHVVDSTGAGDALTSAVLYGLLHDLSLDEAMRLGVTAAALTLHSRESVVPDLTPDMLYEHLII